MTAATPPHEAEEAEQARITEREIGDDITTLARGMSEDVTRPAITDDDEEETKVEPAETAIHAAATRAGEMSTGLSEQASFEREKALRKSSPSLFGSAASGRDSGVEFADPDDEEAAISADPISADPDVDDDDDRDVAISADPPDDIDDNLNHPTNDVADEDSTGTFEKATESSPLAAALTARRPGSPPMGSPFGRDGFGSARLPAPTGFSGFTIGSPAVAPAPGNSPFGKPAPAPGGSPFVKATPVPASSSPFGTRTPTTQVPALQIPAPSGVAAAPTADGAAGFFFRPLNLPIGAGVAFVGMALVVGIVIGAKFVGGPAVPQVSVATTKTVMAPATAAVVAPPSVQPVVPPPAVAPTPIPAAAATPPAPVTKTAATEVPPPAAELAGNEPLKPKKFVAAAPKPRPRPLAMADDLGPAPRAAAPRPAAPKPAKAAKPSKAWVDPFAQ